MDRLLIAVVFLIGAGVGAWYSYARDRRMLAMYENLVEQLSKALRRGTQFRAHQQTPPAVAPEQAVQAEWLRYQADRARSARLS